MKSLVERWGRLNPRVRRLTLRAVFSAAAFLVSWESADRVFLRQPLTSDETSYLFQAHNFLDGVIARPPPPFREAFDHGMVIIDDRAGWLSRYPPGHPIWLMPGAAAGDVRLSTGAAAAIAVWFLCAAASALGIAQALVAVPLLLSPYFVFMYGTFLSHTSGLAASAILCWSYLRGRQTERLIFLVIAGSAWAFLFLNRTYTALLMAIPFGIDAVAVWWRRRTIAAFAQAAAFALFASLGVFAYLLYNKLATGDPFTPTYLLYAPSEGLGFGPRRTQGWTVYHSPGRGAQIFADNVGALNEWLYGFPGSLIVAGIAAVVGWSRRWSPLLAAATLIVWGGYVAFWYPGIKEAGGPVYWFETLAPLNLLVGLGLQRLWAASAIRPFARTLAAAVLAGAVLYASIAFMRREAAEREPRQRLFRQLEETIGTLPGGSLVLLEGFSIPHPCEIAFNLRGLAGERLRALSQPSENAVLQRLFADRAAFLIRGTVPFRAEPLAPPDRLLLVREAKKFHKKTGTDEATPDGSIARVAREPEHPKGWICFGVRFHLPAGRYAVRWLGECRDVSADAPVMADLQIDGRNEEVGFRTITGTLSHVVYEAELILTNVLSIVRPRVKYGGSGALLLRRMEIEELR